MTDWIRWVRTQRAGRVARAGIAGCLLVSLLCVMPMPALAQDSGWTMAFFSAADLDCWQHDAALERAEWRADGVDVAALDASRALWVRLTPAGQPRAMAVVARDQIASFWVDHRDPGAPLRISIGSSPGTSAPGLLAVMLPEGNEVSDAPLVLCLQDRLAVASAVRPGAVVLMAASEFRELQWRRLALLGTALGVMLAMAAMALTFFIGTRERMFSDYAVYVLSFAAYVLNSTDALGWLFPAGLRDTALVYIVVVGAMALMVVHGVRFTQAFTGVDASWPRMSRATMQLAWLCVLAAVLLAGSALLGPQGLPLRRIGATLFNLGVALVIVGMLYPVVREALLARRESRLYLLGWTAPLLVLLGYIAHYIGLTPPELHPSSMLLMQAAALQSLVLGFGIADRVRDYQQARNRALHAAEHDPLTGALNRDALRRQLGQAIDSGEPCSLLYLDIDHFKSINDRLGHAGGDAVLCRLVQRCTQELRGIDVLGRLGGEEFAALLPGADREQGRRVAERIRHGLATDTTLGLPVTVSIGLAMPQPGEDIDAWLERADRALYAAKHGGRNRVEVSA